MSRCFFCEPACQPSWALPFALGASAAFMIVFVVIVFWPARGRVVTDPHGEAFGDQPQVPS